MLYYPQESRSNLRYTSTGDIVYHASSAGVVYRKVGGGTARCLNHPYLSLI